MSQPSQRSVLLRRTLRAVPIAIVVVAVTVLFFAPSAEGRVHPASVPPSEWPMVSLVSLVVLALVVPTGVVVLLVRRRY
ncbi:hypothetical protein SAMN05421812_101596 [Asanoa hainanensis]|uniref:Uncharacterized protein n=1 Tax=Asanoa hainanensis TaxID=560556 RepID=A0A239GWB2_9ACTN|nr:hypothetical protein [Asanoa hainanensis]SNS73499.1 hypothetical protein SAMN05421812_101596 [Asanoa hainanensis]